MVCFVRLAFSFLSASFSRFVAYSHAYDTGLSLCALGGPWRYLLLWARYHLGGYVLYYYYLSPFLHAHATQSPFLSHFCLLDHLVFSVTVYIFFFFFFPFRDPFLFIGFSLALPFGTYWNSVIL